jgi:PAS domain S-box-containing protein
MPWEWIVLAAVLLPLLAGLRMVQRGERTPSAYWIGGWIAAALGGLITLLAVGRPVLRLVSYPLGTLFPWFLLAGAILLAERRVPGWLLPLGLGLGVLRSVLAGFGFVPAAHLAGLVTDLPAVLAAGWFARRAVPLEEASTTQRLLPASFIPLALVGGLHLFWQAEARPQEWILTLWMLVTPPMLGLQLRVGAEWTRRHLVLARHDLERTVVERTAELARVNGSLRRSEERYRTVSELSSDLSFGFRVWRDGRVEGEWVTEAFGRLTGFEAPEMTGDRWLALIHPDDRESVERGLRAALGTGTVTLVFRIVGKQGEVRWLEARERIQRDADGIRIVGAARDVTDARHSEEERFRLERQVQETQRLESLGLVTSGVAHDFNNLLTVILGNGRLALAELPPLHSARPRLERMLAAAEHGAGLTDQMLVYAGRAPRAQKPVELSSLVAEMLDLARASLPARVTLNELLGPAVWVQGDETQLRQIVLNLVANAGEAIGDRAGRVELRTALLDAGSGDLANARGANALEPGRMALLEVVDDGAGMDEATCERVFEPFFTTKLSGRGLGLAAVLGIVRGHRGRVGVVSAPGRGSAFRVWLPAATDRVDAAQPARRGAKPRRGARVLVIDDQEPVLELAHEFLGRAGYDVQTALGGRAGLDRFAAAPADFDAVVLDLAMPELDGDQVGQAVRGLRAELPLLLVSGYDADLAAVRFASLQPAGFLRKPYEREELVAALEQLLVGSGPSTKRPAAR